MVLTATRFGIGVTYLRNLLK